MPSVNARTMQKKISCQVMAEPQALSTERANQYS